MLSKSNFRLFLKDFFTFSWGILLLFNFLQKLLIVWIEIFHKDSLDLFSPDLNDETIIFCSSASFLFCLREEETPLSRHDGSIAENDMKLVLKNTYLNHIVFRHVTCVHFKFTFTALKDDFAFFEVNWSWTFIRRNWIKFLTFL